MRTLWTVPGLARETGLNETTIHNRLKLRGVKPVGQVLEGNTGRPAYVWDGTAYEAVVFFDDRRKSNGGAKVLKERAEPRRAEFRALRASGMTYQAIGDLKGVSRQRAHQIVNWSDE